MTSSFRAPMRAIADGWTVEPVDGPLPDGFPGGRVDAVVPGCVHTDLLRAGLIADPFDGANEAAQQWIGDTTWRYRTGFDWQGDGGTRHDLVALGLDTVAAIELNGVLVARTENQHRSYRFDVSRLLREGGNELVVTFTAPVPEVERRVAEHGAWPHVENHPFNMLRKSAANFGWDWGIDVATCGIWRDLGLESWSGVRVAAVRPLATVEGDVGVLTAHVEIERDGVGDDVPVLVEVTVAGRSGTATVPAGSTGAVVELRVPGVRRWWPVGHGDQPLYDVVVTASTDAGRSQRSGRVGFRTVEVDTAPDADGNRFEVRVNGRQVLVRGVNWIPDHAFVTEIDAARYARRFDDALEANVNLIRVWGGGLYESDDFYDLADERGVLVWQDFLFACAAYPEDRWLADEVEAEAREQIVRLSPHPSLVLWNGNNENVWGYVDWGWREPLAGRAWGDGYYRDLLPGLVAELDPTRAYTPASPYSFVDYAHPNDPRNGSVHIWDVWNERDYTHYRDWRPRFVAEFGFQGPPEWSTLAAVVHDEPLDPYGPQLLVHQKAHQGNLKLERGMAGHLPAPTSIGDWHWATQLNQAHAIRFGIEHFRSLTPHNTGTVLWQLNDNWPVISWAAVDFHGRRKPLWFALRAAYAPRLATVQPRATSPSGHALVLVNDTAQDHHGAVALRRIELSGTELATASIEVTVPARTAVTVDLPAELVDFTQPTTQLLVADLPGFGRAVLDPVEPLEQRLAADPVQVGVTRTDDGYQVSARATSYTRDLVLKVDHLDPDATVDHGLVTLLPGESATFRVRTAATVDPARFTGPPVLRSLNDLVAGGDR